MKVITKKIKPMRVAYLRHIGPYEETRETWNDLTARLSAEKQVRKSSVFIGIGHDDPNVTPPAKLRYDACVTVGEEYQPKKPVALQTIVGGDYAILKNCPLGEIKEAFQFLFGKWLARSSRELRPAPSFIVIVDAHKAVEAKKRRVDIYMPLQPKRNVKKSEQMKIEVTALEPRRVAYMRHVGPYKEAYRTWKDFTARLSADGLPGEGMVYIGIPMDNPKVTPADKLRYDACVTVDEKYAPRKPVRLRMIAGGDYVVARNCPIGAIEKGYEKLYRSWLPGSGRTVRKEPSFLVAVNGHEPTPPGFGFTDIYVPLEAEK
jgi:DNA gyrase inhibitor GyrI